MCVCPFVFDSTLPSALDEVDKSYKKVDKDKLIRQVFICSRKVRKNSSNGPLANEMTRKPATYYF